MDSLVSMRVFCLVAELKSFAAAAERLRLSPAMASKHVMQLEKRLRTRLLNRTSRRVSLSESGALYFEHARQMLDSLDEVEAAVSNATVGSRRALGLPAQALLHYELYPGESFSFAGEHGPETVKFNPVLRSGNETLLHMAALEGMGLAFLPQWLVAGDIAAGHLEHVMPRQISFEGKL